ncbi:hypothetical protein [Lutibacter profundi]|nr:hypothetical protein [Lutibacter profundi]
MATIELVKYLSRTKKSLKKINLNTLDDFNGIITYYETNGTIKKITSYENGIQVNEFNQKQISKNLSAKVPSIGTTLIPVFIDHWRDIYQNLGGGSTYFYYINSHYEGTTVEYVYVNTGFTSYGTYHGHFDDPHGPPNHPDNHPDEILINPNFENTKAECIYNKLNELSTSFKEAIKKFDGDFPVSHLRLTINNNLGLNTYGETQPPQNYITEIQFNENRFGNLSDLGKAIVFAHEIIHAEIFRKMLSAAQQGDLNLNLYSTQERINYINSLKDNFPGIYDYYVERYKPTWNHEMMASHYRNTIADMLQEFDNNRLSRLTYENLAWVGLGKLENNQSTIAWDNLTIDEKQTIEQLINQYFFNGPSNCN